MSVAAHAHEIVPARSRRNEAKARPGTIQACAANHLQKIVAPKRKPGSCSPPKGELLTLADLVRQYQLDYDHNPHVVMAECETFADAVKTATGVIGKVPHHQRRVGRAVLTAACNRLLRCKKRIEACEHFAELIEIVDKKTADVYRFGELAVYDTSLRLGAWLGVLPERVYLHAGTKKGAKALGLDTKWGYLETDELPELLQVLEPREAEDFLCIYKDEFKDCHV